MISNLLHEDEEFSIPATSRHNSEDDQIKINDPHHSDDHHDPQLGES